MTLRVFVPDQGRLRDTVAAVWDAASATMRDGGTLSDIEIVPRRVRYNAAGVGLGRVDVVVTAEDLLAEMGNTRFKTLATWRAPVTKLYWCIPQVTNVIGDIADLNGARVATEFPRLTQQSAAQHGISVVTVTVPGGAEYGPRDGIADAATTSVCSGRTLRQCGLKTIGSEIMTSRLVLARGHDLPLSDEAVLQRFLRRLADAPGLVALDDDQTWMTRCTPQKSGRSQRSLDMSSK